MPACLPTLSVLGQDYTLDVQADEVRNVVFPGEVLTLDRFREIVAGAVAMAEADTDRTRLDEAQTLLRAFDRVAGRDVSRVIDRAAHEAASRPASRPHAARRRRREPSGDR